MYDSLRDLANRVLGEDARQAALADPSGYRLGITDMEGVSRDDPDHNDFLYASLSRPVGGLWLDIEQGHTILGGSRRAGVIGTSQPLEMEVLNSYELTPYDPTTRAATILREWDREEGLAVAAGERGVIEKVELLIQVPEHEGDWSKVIYDEDGPWGHMEMNEKDPIWSGGASSLLRGMKDFLRGEKELIPLSIAEDQVQRWLEDLEDTDNLIPA